MSKEKFDLSNVGGQPKDWAQKDREYRQDFSAWSRAKLFLAPAICVLAIVGGVAYFVLSASKFGS